MGKDFYDWASWGHFIGGISYRLVLFPNEPILSFILSVFIHLLIELMEYPVHPVTGGIESTKNHEGDMFFFILGWLVGCYINPYFPPYSSPLYKSWRFWLLVVVMIFTIKEFFREVFTDKNNPLVKYYFSPMVNGVDL